MLSSVVGFETSHKFPQMTRFYAHNHNTVALLGTVTQVVSRAVLALDLLHLTELEGHWGPITGI